MNIVCINLLRASERKATIIDQWTTKLGLDIEFIEAIDRRNLIKERYNSKLSEGEIACILSHTLAYEYILEQGYKQAVVIEDDAIPLFKDRDILISSINKAQIEFPNLQTLLLHQATRWKNNKSTILEQKTYARLTYGNPYGSYGYMITNSGISFIRDKLLSLTMPMDHFWSFFADNKQLVIMNNPLIGHSVTNTTTYINRTGNRRRKFID